MVLSAVPWFELARVLPGELLRAEPFFSGILTLRPAPIISINFWFDRPVTDLDFAGLRGTTIQWLFNKSFDREVISYPGSRLPTADSRPSYLSLVLSGARDHIARPKEELLEVALRDLADLLPRTRAAKLVHSLVLKERFATFSPTADAEEVRPPARTPIAGLFLAGDWTATGLPATIEGAVRSGYTAAREISEAGWG
jgi:zeta-carotene desaturase